MLQLLLLLQHQQSSTASKYYEAYGEAYEYFDEEEAHLIAADCCCSFCCWDWPCREGNNYQLLIVVHRGMIVDAGSVVFAVRDSLWVGKRGNSNGGMSGRRKWREGNGGEVKDDIPPILVSTWHFLVAQA